MSELTNFNEVVAMKREQAKQAEIEKEFYMYEAKLNEYEKRNPLAVAINSNRKLRFIKVYQPIVDALGHEDGYFLSVLMNRYLYHVKMNNLTDVEWYFLKLDTLAAITKMGEKAQNTRLKSLQNKGIIEIKKMGVGNKRYIKLFTNPIIEMINNDGYVAVLRNIQKDKNKEKAAHLGAGPKPKKGSVSVVDNGDNYGVTVVDNVDNSNPNFLQSGENYFLQSGETSFSSQEKQLSPVRRDILDTNNKPSENKTKNNYIEYPTNPSSNSSIKTVAQEGAAVDELEKDYLAIKQKAEVDMAYRAQQEALQKEYYERILAPVYAIRDKYVTFPNNIVEYLTSKVSKAYETRKSTYDMFFEHYYVIPNLYDQYKNMITDQGFIQCLNDFFFATSPVKSMKKFIETRIKLYLNLIPSKYGEEIYNPSFKKVKFTKDQLVSYRKMYNQFDLGFPWDYYNQITGSDLTNSEIMAIKDRWLDMREVLYNQEAN